MKIEGNLLGFFETGTEGTIWTLLDKAKLGSGEEFSYRAMRDLKDGDDLQIFYNKIEGKPLWEGTLRLLNVEGARKHKYLKMYVKEWEAPWIEKGFMIQKLLLNGRWIHLIPENVDLAFWSDIFLTEHLKCVGRLN